MENEFDILWSKESKFQFDRIVLYLRDKWTEKEVKKFASQIKNFERIVVKFPEIYAESKKKVGLRRAVLSRHNSVIYKVDWGKSLSANAAVHKNPLWQIPPKRMGKQGKRNTAHDVNNVYI